MSFSNLLRFIGRLPFNSSRAEAVVLMLEEVEKPPESFCVGEKELFQLLGMKRVQPPVTPINERRGERVKMSLGSSGWSVYTASRESGLEAVDVEPRLMLCYTHGR